MVQLHSCSNIKGVGFFAMPKGGIYIQYIDLKFCMLHYKVFRYGTVKFCNIFARHVLSSKVSKSRKCSITLIGRLILKPVIEFDSQYVMTEIST